MQKSLNPLNTLLLVCALLGLGTQTVLADETSSNTDDRSAVKEIAELYIQATYEGDAETLTKIFHESAAMNGYLKGQLGLGGPAPFIEQIANSPSLKSAGAPYKAQIDYINVSGKVGAVTVTETGFGDMNFTNYLTMIEVDGEWKIISKTYTSH